jgi:hypothetical protein
MQLGAIPFHASLYGFADYATFGAVYIQRGWKETTRNFEELRAVDLGFGEWGRCVIGNISRSISRFI